MLEYIYLAADSNTDKILTGTNSVNTHEESYAVPHTVIL